MYEILDYYENHENYDFSTEYAEWVGPEDVEHTKILKKYINDPLFLAKLRSVISPEEMDRNIEFSPSTSSSSIVPGFLAVGTVIAILVIIISSSKKRVRRNDNHGSTL